MSKGKNMRGRFGRFPANTLLTYDESVYQEVCGNFPIGGKNGSITKEYEIHNQVYGDYGHCKTCEAYDDSGSAARYFYCAKASHRDREEGLKNFESQRANDDRQSTIDNAFQRGEALRHNIHNCVKPVALMSYLVRLVAPKGATILDPFMGSGPTGKAVMYENRDRNADYNFIGIELNKDYLPIAEARIKYAIGSIEEEKIEDDTMEELLSETKALEKFDLLGGKCS